MRIFDERELLASAQRDNQHGSDGESRVILIPLVVVQPPTPPPALALVETMLDVCSSGLPRGKCVASDYLPEGEEKVVALAVVHVNDDGTAELEIGSETAARGEWVRQEVTFQLTDPPEERWKTVGLLIATLAHSTWEFDEVASDQPASTEPEGESRADSKGSTREQSKDPSVEKAASAQPERRSAQTARSLNTEPKEQAESSPVRERLAIAKFSLLALTGSGFEREDRGGPWQMGFLGRVTVVSDRIPWSGDVSVSWARTARDGDELAVEWLRGEAGLGYVFVWSALDLELLPRALLLLETVKATQRDEESVSHASRRNVGVGVSGGLSYPHLGPWALELEGAFLSMNGATGIEVKDVQVGRVSARGFRLALGASYRF